MEKVKIKVFIHNQRDSFDGTFPYSAWPMNMTATGYTFVEEVEIEFTPPPGFNPIEKEVARLEAEIEKAEMDYDAKVNHLRNQLSNLLCITMEAPNERSAG